MEFKAELIKGEVVVKAIPERKPNGDLVMHVPSFTLIQELKEKLESGKRNIQQV